MFSGMETCSQEAQGPGKRGVYDDLLRISCWIAQVAARLEGEDTLDTT